MNISGASAKPSGWKQSFLWLALAALCFHGAYIFTKIPAAGLLIFGYAYFLVQLVDQPTVRRAFYFGLAAGFLCAAPQLLFFWHIFGPAATALWLILAFWTALFAAIACGCVRRWGKAKAAWLIPFIWTGLEYFRSELYCLKFSWLNVGYAVPQFSFLGMYGVGFLALSVVAILFSARPRMSLIIVSAIAVFLAAMASVTLALGNRTAVSVAGIQMEFPAEREISAMLDQALAKNTNAQIFVLSEYTLDAAPPDSLKNWCRDNSRFLVVGGKDFVTNEVYYNTAFVIGTNGEIVFKQAKSVPIQFFKDGLPASKQELWNSPWGKIGICICYDLSYTRVTDRLIKSGAQLLIVPTMDVEDWGRHEHELHSRVAPVRAAEYGVPIFRLASSGISQAVSRDGSVVAQAPMPGNGEILSATLRLPARGSLPLDRILALFCVGITGIVVAVLVFLGWKNRHAKQGARELVR